MIISNDLKEKQSKQTKNTTSLNVAECFLIFFPPGSETLDYRSFEIKDRDCISDCYMSITVQNTTREISRAFCQQIII